MITVLPESENDVLAVTTSGRLTPEDDDELEPGVDMERLDDRVDVRKWLRSGRPGPDSSSS